MKPSSAKHGEALIKFFSKMNDKRVATPTIIINELSKRWLKTEHLQNIKSIERLGWKIHWVWSVDTCQTWLDALTTVHSAQQNAVSKISIQQSNNAYKNKREDIYFMIAADFCYASPSGKLALSKISKEFDKLMDNQYELSIGQISNEPNSFKELVDTYGTWKLLELWFPKETVVLKKLTNKPRSEFFAITSSLLEEQISKRWVPYEQTLIMLLRLVSAGRTDKINVYEIGLLNEDDPKDGLNEGITQIERMERVLKLYWRESRGLSKNWIDEFEILAHKSHHLMEILVTQLRDRLS